MEWKIPKAKDWVGIAVVARVLELDPKTRPRGKRQKFEP